MRIAWIDVETTGIDAKEEQLLQVACIVTDGELNVLDEEGYAKEIYYSEREVAGMKEHVDSYVLDMHAKTGLWDKLTEGKALNLVDQELKEYLARFANHREAFLGGNSITLDRNFINAYLKTSADFLHYRSIDVSSFAIMAEEWYNGLYFEKKYLHDAMSDIRESIAQLKFLRQTAFK